MAGSFVSIHDAPTAVDSYPENGGEVTLHFGGHQIVRFYTGQEALARDLRDAIAAVLAKHAKQKDAA